MSQEHMPTLQNIAADRDWWSADAGEHYRELAHWLRGVAAKWRFCIGDGKAARLALND
jgi:hypothetical protein